MPNKEKQKKALKDWIRTEGGYQPEPLIGDHELTPPSTGSNVKVPKKVEPVGYVNTCVVCGSKYLDSEVKMFPLCPRCAEKKHDDSVLPQMEAFKYATSRLNSNFIKNDSGKLQWSLMPFVELEEVVRVLMNGAKTYSPDNWKKCDDVNRYKDALMRHVVSYITGETYDVGKGGDGLHHLAHAVCDCLFLMWFDNQKDDKASE